MKNKFDIVVDGVKYNATIICNFNLFENKYCIYTIPIDNQYSNIYCAKIIDDKLFAVYDEGELEFTNGIVKLISNTLKNKGV